MIKTRLPFAQIYPLEDASDKHAPYYDELHNTLAADAWFFHDVSLSKEGLLEITTSLGDEHRWDQDSTAELLRSMAVFQIGNDPGEGVIHTVDGDEYYADEIENEEVQAFVGSWDPERKQYSVGIEGLKTALSSELENLMSTIQSLYPLEVFTVLFESKQSNEPQICHLLAVGIDEAESVFEARFPESHVLCSLEGEQPVDEALRVYEDLCAPTSQTPSMN